MSADYVGWALGALGLAAAGVQTFMARRSDARLKRLEDRWVQKAIDQPEDARRKTDFFAEVETQELKEALGEAIAGLPEREKLVVTLYYYEGLTLAETAEVLGISPSTVSRLHTKAVLRLKSRLPPQSGQGAPIS